MSQSDDPRELAGLFGFAYHGVRNAELDAQFPFFHLNSPGIPPPGPNFLAAAAALTPPANHREPDAEIRLTAYKNAQHYLYRRALYDDMFTLTVEVNKGLAVETRLLPGHLLGGDARNFNGGPHASDVLLIGKHPGQEEMLESTNFVGPTSEDLFQALTDLGISATAYAEWYVTNAVKWPQLDRQGDRLSAHWIKDCLPLLHQELRLVRPRFILCIGSDAALALLGKGHAVSDMLGRVTDYNYPTFEPGETPSYVTAKAMVLMHPAAVHRRPELYDAFKDQLGLFWQLINGAEIGGVETDIHHELIYTHAHLQRVVDEILADPSRWRIAVDAEWHKEHETTPGAYLRTIQFSPRDKEAYGVVLRHQGGSPAFQPGLQYAFQELRRLFTPEPDKGYMPQIGGHFFRADLPRLLAEGLDLRGLYDPACGGWDTSLEYHAVNEAASYKLEDVAMRLTTAPRYDVGVQKWKEAYCAANGLKAKDLDGYGAMPAWLLHSYSMYDPDVTKRIDTKLTEPGGLLEDDRRGNNCWQPYRVAHAASLAFLEMEMNGITLDRQRVEELTATFMAVREILLDALRRDLNWPTFNPQSAPQCVAMMFGDNYARRKAKDGSFMPVRPATAVSLNLPPLKSTGKRSKQWADLVRRNEQRHYNPSTDKEVLGILGHSHPLAMRLRDLKFVGQVLKSVLRPPVMENEDTFATDDDGWQVFEAGLPASAHPDGKIRTHLSQTKETGRAASYRFALQNLSKRREDDYSRILGHFDRNGQPKGAYLNLFGAPLYVHPIRSVLKASPGCVLVECDLKGAESAMLAWLANDPVMIEHVRRNDLPPEHPDHYDMHAQTAVRVFHLDCEPTKRGLELAGKKGMRVAAKNVAFGVPYGRSAEAISRQCREEGADVTPQEAQAGIDFYLQQYNVVAEYLAECRSSVTNPGHVCTYLGRLRRVVASRDSGVLREQERQFQNFPIQGSVADAVSVALANLLAFRRERPDIEFKLLLQIHDAILFEVPARCLQEFLDVVPRTCISERVPVWPTRLDGTLITNVGPYYFGVDTEVYVNWGEKISDAEKAVLGIDFELH